MGLSKYKAPHQRAPQIKGFLKRLYKAGVGRSKSIKRVP